MATQFSEVYESFESSFKDKTIIPQSLEFQWLKKAVAQYSVEIDKLEIDESNEKFTTELDQYVIDAIAEIMRVLYQEREVSKVNKRVSIVTKSISIDGNGNSKTAANNELQYHEHKTSSMLDNLKPTAYV